MDDDKAAGSAPQAGGRKPNGLVIRASNEWREWIRRAADHDRTTVADFLDRAAAIYARQLGFKEMPPKR